MTRSNRPTLRRTVRLAATGGGPGGGWNACIEFRPLSRGFSVWADPPDSDDWSGGERKMRKVGASAKRLTWRDASSWLLEADDWNANRVGVSPTTIYHEGVDDWQGELLALCWVDPEVEEAFPEQRDWLLGRSDQELEDLRNSLGSLRSVDSLLGIHELVNFAPDLQLDDATRIRVLCEQAEAARASGSSLRDHVADWIQAQSRVLDEAYEGERDRVNH